MASFARVAPNAPLSVAEDRGFANASCPLSRPMSELSDGPPYLLVGWAGQPCIFWRSPRILAAAVKIGRPAANNDRLKNFQPGRETMRKTWLSTIVVALLLGAAAAGPAWADSSKTQNLWPCSPSPATTG